MATKYYCDRCEKEVGVPSLLSSFDLSGMTARDSQIIELCSKCVNEFFNNFMNPSKEPNG